MIRFWRRLTWQGRLVFLLLLVSVGMSALANVSLFQMVGQMGLGVWLYWEPGLQCLRVSPVVSPYWPPIAQGQLHPSDCLYTIGGRVFYYQPDLQRYLTDEVAGRRGENEVHVTGLGKDGPIDTQLSLYPWTVHAILQAHLLNFIPGLALWLIGLLVFLARPNESVNQIIAAFLFLGGMLLMGINHWMGNFVTNMIFDMLTNVFPRPLLGLLILKFTMLFPEPITKRRWHGLLWVGLILTTWLLMTAYTMALLRLVHTPAIARALSEVVEVYINTLFLTSGTLFIARLYLWKRRHPTPRLQMQTALLALALLSSFPITLIDLINRVSGMLWPMLGLSNLTAMAWLIPGAAMLAYAMLRYQAFAYRGQFLSILLVFFISAVIVQIYTLVITLGRIDGVQWAMLWGAVLLTTLLFYVDTPLRRSFIRYFSRHSYDYEIVAQFVQQMGKHPTTQQLLRDAVEALCRWLRVEWVVIWSSAFADRLWIARHEGKEVETPLIAEPPSAPPFPDVVHQEPLWEGTQHLGVVWIGPRVTAEPFDEKDQRLAHLLATELARMLALRVYITELEAIPGRILTAVDRERARIGRDLHDGILQFLGALPFVLERIRSRQVRDPTQAEAIIDDTIRQIEVISQDTRGLAYDLSLPGVREGKLLEMSRSFAETQCRLADVELVWHVYDPIAWKQVMGPAAVHVYRILQESVANALRHGHPTRIRVTWDAWGETLVLEIRDDGSGMAKRKRSASGLGMTSMRERARVLGGRLEVDSQPGRGVRVRLIFDLK